MELLSDRRVTVNADVAEHVRGEVSVGIIALGVGREDDAVAALVRVFIFADRLGVGAVDLAGDDLVVGILVLREGHDLLIGHAVVREIVRQNACDPVEIPVVFHDVRRGENDGVLRGALGQNLAVGIENRAAEREHILADNGLLNGLLLVVILLENHQISQSAEKEYKSGNAAH